MNKKQVLSSIEAMYVADQNSWKTNEDNTQLIHRNTENFIKIVEEYGCITISQFGEKTSHYAWLLAQHSNHNIHFQESYLQLMIESKDVLMRDIAYLTDRILILKGLPQIYGTQFDPKTLNGDYSPYPIKDISIAEGLRSEMGLDTLAEQKKTDVEEVQAYYCAQLSIK